jgi:alanine-glyoxylate transaminase/serine-glyoxylate transaminase/serine-pyruvate transaminase
MMPTGLVVVALSDRVIEQLDRTATYYDFADMLACNEQGYYPYTPAMTLMRGLRTATDMLLEEGMENVWERHNRLANGVRKAVERWSMDTQPFDKTTCSDTVTAVNVCDKIDAREIINHAYHKYGISLGAGLGPLAGKVFRIGHLGWLNEAMILQVLSGVELTMSDLEVKFQPGSGVGAAIETYVNKIYVTSYKV